MTREEAIEILKYNSNVIHKTINGETDPNEVEALDMAISALEHPEKNVVAIVPCGDAISRLAVLELIADNDLSMGQVVRGIHALPSVTPQEPVKKLEKQIKQLQNRCHALTHGQICVFCPYECEHKAESEDKE